MMEQAELIEQIKLYLDSRPDYAWELPANYDIDVGVCSGLVALWLYRLRTDNIRLFDQECALITNWQPSAAPNQEIEHFINAILFLQRDSAWRPGIMQNNLATTFNLLLDAQDPHIAAPEFSATIVFDNFSLESLLKKILLPNKMLRITSNEHVIGLMNRNSKYLFYDPNNMPIVVKNISQVVTEIIKSLGDTVIRIDIYDLVNAEPNKTKYPDNYAAEMLRNPDLALKAAENNNLFYLAVIFSDYATLDNLFEKQLIDKHNARAELIQAISNSNPQMLKYLIAKGVTIENITPDQGLSILGNAVNAKSVEMVCILLDAGADPNIAIMRDYHALDFALDNQLYAMAAILLATGAKLTITKENAKIIKKNQIVEMAIKLNAKLLDVVDEAQLGTASTGQLVNYLLHLHCKLKLGAKLTSNDFAAIKIIRSLYKLIDEDKNNLICLEEKAELYELLESLDVRGFSFEKFTELAQIFDAIVANVLSKPFSEHTLSEIRELPTILHTIDVFLDHHKLGIWSRSKTRDIVDKATATKETLLQYLKTYGISDLNAHNMRRKTGLYFGKRGSPEEALDTYNKLQVFFNKI